MNGKKVLSGLIKLFIGLNLILLVLNSVRSLTEHVLSKNRVENILTLLAEESISVEGELIRNYAPKKQANLLYEGDNVSVRDKVVSSFFGSDLVKVKRYRSESTVHIGEEIRYYSLEHEILAFDKYELNYKNELVDQSVPKQSIEEAKRLCINLMKRMGIKPSVSQYILEAREETDHWQMTYYYKLEGLPVLDLFMSFKVYGDGISEASLYIGEIELTSDKGQEIYPIDLVLFGLEEILLENEWKKIVNISMAYKRLEEEERIWGHQIVPVYKIVIEGLEKPVFVNAYTNNILDLVD